MNACFSDCQASHVEAIEEAILTGTHPLLAALWAWIQTIVAKTPALLPYVPQIVADIAAGNYASALALVYEVLTGNFPPVAAV